MTLRHPIARAGLLVSYVAAGTLLSTHARARDNDARAERSAAALEPPAPVAARVAVMDPARAAPPESPPPSPSRYTSPGLLGSVRMGPTIGVGVPDGGRLGLFAKWRGLVGVGAALSLLPSMPVPGAEAKVVRASGEFFARVHPFRGAFYVGVAGGYAQTKGTITEQVVAFRQSQRVEVNAYASTAYVAPHIGFQWMLPHGFTLGCDAGVEIPIAANAPTFDASSYGLVLPVEATGRVANATRALTTIPVPVVRLLEVGYAL